ncbi:MAG: glutamate-5-semialdehyde dehydrogenase [bacterium]|nr:glutamate-5-semialdehyde dehydrogenase [bacterium]
MNNDILSYVTELGRAARAASRVLANLCADAKNAVLNATADALEREIDYLTAENTRDLAAARAAGLSPALIDRLTLTPERIRATAAGVRTVATLPDPVGRVLDQRTRPSGITITKVRVPIGVIAIIYEARPNVTIDAASLCLKSGNAVILRGGSEALHSNAALARLFQQALVQNKLPAAAVQFVDTPDRTAVDALLRMEQYVDLVIPRGGKSLIRKVAETSRIPVLKHYEGICHTYIAKDADIDKAIKVCLNAKVQRPGVCNAMETLLIDSAIAPRIIPPLFAAFRAAHVELRGCPRVKAIDPNVRDATEEDWRTEYLDLILSVKIVDGVDEAIAFINEYGSHHSDAIITESPHIGAHFLQHVDSATVYVNASTRFTDGGEFGMGCEMGISTDKLHARGPVGLEELTTYKYMIRGDGSIRT